MDWAEHVEASVIRGRLVSAQWWFSPFAGWPPSWASRRVIEFSGHGVGFGEIAVALSAVSSSSPLWEAQAQIVDYCSRGTEDPAPQWAILAALDPAGRGWGDQEGLPRFLADARLAVPYHALVSAGTVMSRNFRPDVLDGLGYVVASPDLEQCLVACEGSPDRDCVSKCLAGRLSFGRL